MKANQNGVIQSSILKDREREIHTCFTSNTFIFSARQKFPNNLRNGKQHPQAELLLFENHSHSF